jgi:hypothetical protein
MPFRLSGSLLQVRVDTPSDICRCEPEQARTTVMPQDGAHSGVFCRGCMCGTESDYRYRGATQAATEDGRCRPN